MRDSGQKSISEEGKKLAEAAGRNTVRFDRVITSTVTRAIETAQAMGYEPDLTLELLSKLKPGVEDEVYWDSSFLEYSEAFRKKGAVYEFGIQLAELVREQADSLADGQNLLIVTHGGIVQIMAVACLPDADHSEWGGPCSYCEGIHFEYDDCRFASVLLVRNA